MCALGSVYACTYRAGVPYLAYYTVRWPRHVVDGLMDTFQFFFLLETVTKILRVMFRFTPIVTVSVSTTVTAVQPPAAKRQAQSGGIRIDTSQLPVSIG